ncbi:MAG: hypothetical protein ABIH37_03545 [archaeon]
MALEDLHDLICEKAIMSPFWGMIGLSCYFLILSIKNSVELGW